MQFKDHITKKALFDQKILAGDIINIYDKQEDGWWLGELKGQVGIFPATYVEDIILNNSSGTPFFYCQNLYDTTTKVIDMS